MSNISHLKTPAPFKNDILSNMIQKFTEEAKKQFELSNALSKKQSFHEDNHPNREMLQDNPLLHKSAKHLNEHDDKIDFLLNKISSPNDFKQKKSKDNNSNGKEPKLHLESLVNRHKENHCLSTLMKKISLTRWMTAYLKHISPSIQSIDEMVNKLKSYSFDSKTVMCEVKEVTVLDCIQIITAKDIRLSERKIILTKSNCIYESVGDLISDDYLKEGDVFLCNNIIKCNSDFIRLNISDIQK